MIDLSQSHSIQRDVMRRVMYSAVKNPYREYPILGVDPKKVVLRSYSIEGFLFDHMTMIHHTDEEPWNVKKKEKRIARYVGFLFAHVFSPNVENTYASKVRAMQRLVDKLSSLDTLLASPLRTGVKPVDEFAARERKSLASAPKGKGREYLKTMGKILRLIVETIQYIPRYETINLKIIAYMQRHIFNEKL